VIFDIDVQGARQIKASMGQGCYIFVFPPSRDVLERRLTGRGTDSAEVVARRLAAARGEIMDSHWFDHWIVNDDLQLAYDQLRSIYEAEKTRPAYRGAWREDPAGVGGSMKVSAWSLPRFCRSRPALDLLALRGIVPWVKVGLEPSDAGGTCRPAQGHGTMSSWTSSS
jgi:hypothetical protein